MTDAWTIAKTGVAAAMPMAHLGTLFHCRLAAFIIDDIGGLVGCDRGTGACSETYRMK
jgi:hypothetical protein